MSSVSRKTDYVVAGKTQAQARSGEGTGVRVLPNRTLWTCLIGQESVQRCRVVSKLSLSREETARLADLARLSLSDDELARIAHDLTEIIDYMERLAGIDRAHVRPRPTCWAR